MLHKKKAVTSQKFEVSKIVYCLFVFLKEINTFMLQGCIKLIKSYIKVIYNVINGFYNK